MATVAILVILMAVALPAVIQIQKNLRQKELDAKAEIIYVAAQNAISKLKAGGNTEVYQYTDGSDGVGKINEIPSDADSDKDNIKKGDICYFTSAEMGPAASAVMNRDTVDEALLNNRWVVEYNPSSAIIYAVFYSEDRVNCAEGYKDEFSKYDLLRGKEARLADGANVGYYGGGSAAASSTVTTMTPKITIINKEKLAANISCVLPTSISDYPVFKVDLKDGKGTTYTKYYAYINCSPDYRLRIESVAGSNEIDYTHMERSGRVFKLELILDDLSSESTRFVNAYGKGSGHSAQLEAGTSLTVTVTAMCPGNHKYTGNLFADAKTNSLFADESEDDTAVISYARHLQNLDASSGVTAAVTTARQSSDLTFTEELPAVSSNQYIDWFETYRKGYFNGFTAGVPNFEPIQNNNLQSYDGTLKRISKLTTSAESDAGLFAALGGGQTVSNVVLTGTNVKSQNGSAGALVGNVTGNAVIKQCQAYLTTPDIKGKDNHDVWIQGNTAGGLIGTVTGDGVAVKTSAASTVVGGHAYYAGAVQSYDSNSVGGLIGSVASGSVTIEESYADCYLFGKTVGGLVGTSHGAVTLTSCYAAGFETFETKGAGLVCGAAEMTEAYTIMYRIDVESTKPYSGTAESGRATDVYYLAASTSDKEPTIGSPISSMDVSALTSGSNAAFTSNTATAQPYNLMGQALTAYQYPVLDAVKHYGDWMADFQEGTLVYYEKYSDNTYGFFGANVTSTLKDDANLTVVGDGYGIVYQDGVGTLPTEVTVTVKNGGSTVRTETLTVNGGSSYPVIGTDGMHYNIYPLSKELVNTTTASAAYYLKAEITSVGKKDTYYFNPHFAKTVVGPLADASAPAPVLTADSNIAVRTPRHLYMMSLYYDVYAKATAGCTFAQERNIDYADYYWTDYSTRTDDKRSQAPIAGKDTAFQATYDGGCHWITNVNFTTETGLYVGFIGQNAGTIQNVVLTATYEEGRADNYHVRRSGNIEHNRAVFMGVLAGRNTGLISNCAAAGYYIAGSDGTIHAYENSNLYAGGLVGENAGKITNCSADTPALRLSSTFARVYLGGFVGNNTNYISNCYALGHIEVAFAKGGSVSIAGFAGENGDTIQNSYCATALTASGNSTTSYGFAPAGGRVQSCEYLNNGTYTYVHHMYPFNFDPCDGTSTTFLKLKANGAGYRPVNSYNFQNTKTVSEQYPFRAVVRDGSGDLVHYGDWLDDENMGTVGIFYWEHEERGSNNGYHFTYLGTEDDKTMGGTTLCNAHDDGGVITEYGYGYFELNKGSVTSLTLKDATINGGTTFKSGTDTRYNQAASEELEKQMHKTLDDGTETSYYFYAFTTRTKEEYEEKADGKGYLCMSGTSSNCTWTLTHEMNEGGTTEYAYTVSPFFANAMSCDGAQKVTAFDGTETDYSQKPGAVTENQYEIRSIQQLQYINWYNEGLGNTSTLVDSNTYKRFTYLMYARYTGQNSNTADIAIGDVMYWRQTHDVDATGFEGYTPIAGNYVSSSAQSYNAILYAWFGGNYNGESYKIQNLSIKSKSFAVGLFGVTVGANMKNIIMYSDDDNVEIERSSDSKEGAYSLGGLIGVAYDYNVDSTKNTIENCAIAGYQIVDSSTNQQGLGEANVGGLIGVSRVHLKNCSAVTDILLNAKPEKSAQYGVFIRVGGLTGAAQGSVINCYSGGSAKVSDGALNHNTTFIGQNKYEIYIGGIMGSAFTSNYQNFNGKSGASDGSPTIENCYTYFKFPATHSKIKAMYPIASAADRAYESSAATTVTIKNCYYLNSVMTPGVTATYGPKTSAAPTSVTYTQMSDGTLLGKLGSPFSSVTTTEGSANVPINGKYSFPGSNAALEGKNYPFPAVIQQKDLTFSTATKSVYVYVHYGDWPIDGPYWTRGRDSMDIFADMQADEYASKTFYLNPNGEDLSGIDTTWFTCDPDSIAEVVAVDAQDSKGLYPVTIRAKNTGSATITFKKGSITAEFSLEVTANIDIDVQTEPTPLKLKEKDNGSITLSAKSLTDAAHLTQIDYSTDDNTSWNVETVEDGSEDWVTLLQRTPKNNWQVTRNDLGKVTLKAIFTYHYHGAEFTAAAYVDVLQPDTVGLSDGQSQYNVAYLGTDTTGRTTTYSANKPFVEDANFFLYLDAETLKIDELTIKSISVGGNTAQKKTDEPGNVYETEKFHMEWDAPTADMNYQYLPGSIYVKDSEDAKDVELEVKVSSGGHDCTLSITLPVVKKALTITYQDKMEAGAQSFTKRVSVGKHKLPTQAELPADFTIPVGKMLAGWTVGEDATVYLPGSLYDFTADATFTAVFEDAVVTLDANGGTFDGGKETEEMKPEDGKIALSPKPTRGSYKFTGWNTKADGSGTDYNAGASVDVSALAPEYKLYAQWKPYTLTLINEGEPVEFKNVNGAVSLPKYESGDFARAGYTLVGWYTKPNNSGTMVLDSDGKVVERVEGYSKYEGENLVLELTGDQKLFARWKKLSNKYILTEELRDGENYLLVSTNEAGEESDTRVAFGPKVNPGPNISKQPNQDSNVPVKITAGEPNYILKDMSAYPYAVFHCSDGGFLSNIVDGNVRYLNFMWDKNGGTNYQYELGSTGVTRWDYFGNDATKPYYNRNVLYILNDSRYPNISSDINSSIAPGNNTQARRLSYMGRLPQGGKYNWTANAFAVKATKDELEGQNSDMFLYEQQYEYAFSTEAIPGSVMASMYSTRAVTPAESAALTLADGTRTVLSTEVSAGAAQAAGYTAPTRVNSEWALLGWYTAKDGTGTKVLNADGTVTGDAGVSGLSLSGDTTLYACWTRETDIFVRTDTLEQDADYLLVLGSGEESRAVGQVGETVVEQPVTVHEPGDGSYEVYDTETDGWSPVDGPYITAFSDQTVWHYAVDDAGSGTLTATDGSSRESALRELADSDISIYRRTAVRERSFEDEYLMLTLCTGTGCVTEVVPVADGAWTDAWSAACRKLENGWRWFDSPDGGNAVLDAEGHFAAADVKGYVENGRWIYDGGSLTLYARVNELPETELPEDKLLPQETEEDKKKRTPHKLRIDDVEV